MALTQNTVRTIFINVVVEFINLAADNESNVACAETVRTLVFMLVCIDGRVGYYGNVFEFSRL